VSLQDSPFNNPNEISGFQSQYQQIYQVSVEHEEM